MSSVQIVTNKIGYKEIGRVLLLQEPIVTCYSMDKKKQMSFNCYFTYNPLWRSRSRILMNRKSGRLSGDSAQDSSIVLMT